MRDLTRFSPDMISSKKTASDVSGHNNLIPQYDQGCFNASIPISSGQKDSRARVFLEGFFRKGLSLVDSPYYSHMIRWDNTALLKGFFSAEMQHTTSNLEPFADRFIASLPPDFMNWDPLSRAQYTESTLFLSNYLVIFTGRPDGNGPCG